MIHRRTLKLLWAGAIVLGGITGQPLRGGDLALAGTAKVAPQLAGATPGATAEHRRSGLQSMGDPDAYIQTGGSTPTAAANVNGGRGVFAHLLVALSAGWHAAIGG